MDSILFLLASLVVLLLGPVLFHLARSKKHVIHALDGFVLIAVTGLVAVLVLPHCVETAGWWTLAFAGIGFLGPALMERWHRPGAHQAHRLSLILVLTGLILHAAVDGIALNTAHLPGHNEALPLAIVLHRLTVGIAIWWLLQPAYGSRWAWGTLVLMAIATCVGFGIGGSMGSPEHLPAWAFFEALVGGMLLHVIFHLNHSGAPRAASDTWNWASGVGGLIGGGLIWVVTSSHGFGAHGEENLFAHAFLALVMESAPMLLLAYLAAGMVHAFFSESTVAWMQKGGSLRQALRGMAFGLPLPVCSCGVVPLYQGLVTRGAPAAAAMAFLVATPELGLDAVLLSLPLLGPHMTISRIVAAAVVALLIGWFIGPMAARSTKIATVEDMDDPEENRTFREKVRYGLQVGFGEVVDKTGPWIVIGLVIAAAMVPALKPEWIAGIPPGYDVVAFALIGMPTYVCASGATPFVAVLLLKGISPGAALAFLLSGPATNVVTFGVLSQLHGKKVAFAFGGSIAALAIASGLVVNQLLPEIRGFSMESHNHDGASYFQWISAGLLFAVFGISMLRQGTRPFFGQVFRSAAQEEDHRHHSPVGGHTDDTPPGEETSGCGADSKDHDH